MCARKLSAISRIAMPIVASPSRRAIKSRRLAPFAHIPRQGCANGVLGMLIQSHLCGKEQASTCLEGA